jgi:hypothetical protein
LRTTKSIFASNKKLKSVGVSILWGESRVQGRLPLPEREVSSQKNFSNFPPQGRRT